MALFMLEVDGWDLSTKVRQSTFESSYMRYLQYISETG